MKLLHRNKGELKIKVASPEDLWYLKYIIDKDDILIGKTYRKINLGGENEKSKVVKKPMIISIKVENVKYEPPVLRVNGVVVDSKDNDIPNGSHQSINIELNTIFVLKKDKLLSYQEEKLKDALKEKEDVLIVIHDREDCIIASLSDRSINIISRFHGDVAKKDVETKSDNFYEYIAKSINDYKKRGYNKIILASPSFFNEYVMRYLDKNDNIITATVSSVSENAISELLKRNELKNALAKQRVADETVIVERMMKEIMRDGNVMYGINDVKKAVEAGAVEELIVSDRYLMENEIDELLKMVERMDGKIHIITTTHEAGERLYKMGGIAALLRYKII